MRNIDLKTKQAVIEKLSREYRYSNKKKKGAILDELIHLLGYNRCYARRILRKPFSSLPKIRVRTSKYVVIFHELRKIWTVSNFSCGKILVSAIPNLIEALERFDEITLTDNQKRLFLEISSATIDRMLKVERRKLAIKGRSGTKPGTLLKSQIPVRIFTPWDEQTPGFVEIDLVAHCADSNWGEFVNTLDAVDIATTWSEKQALMGKSERFTLEAYDAMEKRFPFKILGIDSDNGSEFINDHFYRMTQRRNITFTRSRANRKNDQAHIEQKNFSTVRKLVGYKRFSTHSQLATLNKIYTLLSDYLNFFIPTLKLVRKEHIGSKVKRIYDRAKTPYQRVLEHPEIDGRVKRRLRVKYLKLNPAKLLREINGLADHLAKL